jgi:EmrB/QacA subfamily drug resistance transporter
LSQRARRQSDGPPAHDTPNNIRAILFLLGGVVFLAVVNGTMINVALPHIGESFQTTEGVYGWLVTGYALAFGIFNAIDGKLGDIIGLRRMYLSGIAVLGLSALVLAFSPSIEFAITLRVIQGMGAASLPVMGSTIISVLVPPDKRGWAMGIILSAVGFAASVGPILGGVLLEFTSWRVVFACVGVVLLAFPAAHRLLPNSLDDVQGDSFDFTGALLLGGGVASMMYGFNVVREAGFGASFWATTSIGVALLIGYAVWIRLAESPFTDPTIFGNSQYIATCVQAFAANGSRFGTIVLIPIFLKEVNDLSPIYVGLVLFPGALAIGLLSQRAGSWADRRGPREPVIVGTSLLTLGNLITAWYAGGSPWGVTLGMGVVGLGFAFTQTPLLSTASQVLPDRHTSSGMGLFMMILFVGGAFGVALGVTSVELQPASVPGLLGLPFTAPAYGNAMLGLSLLGTLGLSLVGFLPGRPDAR